MIKDIKILTATNQYNCAVLQLIINYEKCTYEIRYGAECRWSISNATRKQIQTTIDLLKASGFVEVR